MKSGATQNHRFIYMILFAAMMLPSLHAQTYKWLSVGSLHNFYTDIGCEREEVRPGSNQQDGMQWPAIYRYRDSQCAKGLWIGAKNFTNEIGKAYDFKVVHVGPRSNGLGEFFPVSFKMYSKFDIPQVLVDGNPTFDKNIVNDDFLPGMAADRMIVNVVNTQLGLTLKRKIMQFSNPNHDNYHVMEITFKNTGNVDDDAEIELPATTLEDVYIYYQYRLAPTFQSRYVIGNASGWGINTMNDARGDGASNMAAYNDPADEQFRAQFAWHGYWTDRTPQHYDNIGGPIWDLEYYSVTRGYITDADTVGRLAGANFLGVATLYADDPNNPGTDSPEQPSTTNWIYSNAPETMANDAENGTWMQKEYENYMASGHMYPRHAWAAEPTGNFAEQKAQLQSDAGYSFGNGYGPYTLGPGDSVKIVMIEAVAGLSNDMCVDIGRQYKKGQINAVTKNEMVLTGKDSLFKSIHLAQDNFASGYTVGQAARPPKSFLVQSGGDRIALRWDVEANATLTGFKIYRTAGSYNDHFQDDNLIYTAKANERSFDDLTPIRGIGYFYYIIATYQGGLTSSRYYTQTYDPAYLTRPAGKSMDEIRVVPNPYIISASVDRLRFGNTERDKIAFFNIPGQCTIKIYTELGELVNTIEHTNGSGDGYWNCTTSSNQLIVSGIYIAIVTDNDKGDKAIVKFVVIR
ncbi:MAG: hypothetical protein E4H13_12760 [Calditrichales bacterium]|nr:MAG: hypothetical protein E4H13_12760 [Calditrichales bacterium]